MVPQLVEANKEESWSDEATRFLKPPTPPSSFYLPGRKQFVTANPQNKTEQNKCKLLLNMCDIFTKIGCVYEDTQKQV